MFTFSGLRSWNFAVDNLEEAARFYRVLGAQETGRQTIAGAEVIRFRLGESGIGLFDGSAGPRPGIPHHTFRFDGPADPEEMIEALKAEGITVVEVRMHGKGPGYSVYVNDPGGNRLELSTDPA